MEYIPLYIKNLCFNCNNTISSYRLSHGLPCENDLDDNEILELLNIKDENTFRELLYKKLSEKGKLKDYSNIYNLYKEVNKFSEFFKKALNSNPWKVQIMWFERLYKNNSFSMIAPTGVGKSTFIIISSIYFSSEYNKKILIILPTRLLVKQFNDLFDKFVSSLNLNIKVISYYGSNKKEIKEKIKNEDFNILIISNQFLTKNFDILKGKKFDIAFVDDVDSFFKGSKNIEKLFILIGYSEDDINVAKKVIDLKLAGKLDFNSDLYKRFLEIKNKNHGLIVLSSATGSLRGKRVRLYKELANFTIGTGSSKIRNVIDVYYIPKKDIKEELLNLLKELEDGGLIFVPKERGIEYMKEIYNYLISNNVKVGLIYSKTKTREIESILNDFYEGKINFLISITDPYGILTRGINMPERIKYAIFLGIPKIKINIRNLEKNIMNIIILSNLILPYISEIEKDRITKILTRLRKNMKKLSSGDLKLISDFLNGNNVELVGYLKSFANDILTLYNILKIYIDRPEILDKLKENPDVSIEVDENKNIYLNIVDLKTYLQASGRTSRLYSGGISKGLSIVFVDDEKLLKSLDMKLRYYLL
ncbi:reverse gyrase [Candidatus Nanobsidianus stetteri]|uniref:Reverse gyrase n=1 Tax=Nanobsidianus stetteri TaxID=1294122 RepID=A0A2T9WSZ6_NANST|nr:reverse gyrase [Candidatus Nanobsidianus stetteri]